MGWLVKTKVTPVQSAAKYGAYLGDTKKGEVPQPQSGDVMYDFQFPDDGAYKFSFSAFDSSGNESGHPNFVEAAFDHMAPPAPGTPQIVMSSWMGSPPQT